MLQLVFSYTDNMDQVIKNKPSSIIPVFVPHMS
jgi:hypothetical protein